MVRNKAKTSLAKFEEFFLSNYKDEIYTTLENFPNERSIIIDYHDLESFDVDLANLLIEKPDDVIAASQKAIKNIDPLMKDVELNVRFKNLTNFIPMNKISSIYIGNFVVTRGLIRNLDGIHPRIETGVFECRGCMRWHEVEQTSSNVILEPSLCNECGGRSFRLLQEESKYIDTQTAFIKEIVVDDSPRIEAKNLLITLEDDLVDQLRNNDIVDLTGILKTFREEKTGKFINYLYVNNIHFVKKWGVDISDEYNSDWDLYSEVSRDSPEYNEWRRSVLRRDGEVCQCCGLGDKLEAHHLYGYEENKDLAYDVGNGVTLCQFCHSKYHSVYGIKDINPAKFVKFIRRFGSG